MDIRPSAATALTLPMTSPPGFQFQPPRPEVRRWVVQKVHVDPRALPSTSASEDPGLERPWQAALSLARWMASLPGEALDWWAQAAAGHVVLASDGPEYRLLDADGRHAVVRIPALWTVQEPQRALSWALMPLDHLLGCWGKSDGRWLSDGGGIAQAWQEVGRQIARYFALGYGLTPDGQGDPHRYLAEGWAAALMAPRTLNTADPKLYRLLRATLLSPGFWRRHLPTHPET